MVASWSNLDRDRLSDADISLASLVRAFARIGL